MANRWGNSGNSVRLYFLRCSKISANGDCSLEIKRHLLTGRKVMTNLDSILKCRDITLPTKFHLVKAMVFPVAMHEYESWTIKKAVQFNSIIQSCLTLCDPMDCNKPVSPVHYQIPELAQIHVNQVGDAIQPSHPLSSPSPPNFNLS